MLKLLTNRKPLVGYHFKPERWQFRLHCHLGLLVRLLIFDFVSIL